MIERLSHVGIHVFDLGIAREFYVDVLGLTVTDEDFGKGVVFLSSHPELEHHEILLASGREVDRGAKLVQQISFRVESLDALLVYFTRLKSGSVPIDMIVSHGNAIGIYFYDPDGNRLEVFWATGLEAHQVFLQPIDLCKPRDEILAEVGRQVVEFGSTGVVSPVFLRG